MAPVEFVMFAYIVGKFPERSSDQLKLDLVSMRKYVRTRFIDIRFNSSVYNCIMDFIRTISEQESNPEHHQSSPDRRVTRERRHVRQRLQRAKRTISEGPLLRSRVNESQVSVEDLKSAPKHFFLAGVAPNTDSKSG
ncbi:hypothetical protein K7432_017418 [Basidiobolus ranarum]|uniref:Uncharacterized protein n=1 Tax=Basidiobolus ranarum TaxID=34480 RepID=A0ABR2WDD9_9FUNG